MREVEGMADLMTGPTHPATHPPIVRRVSRARRDVPLTGEAAKIVGRHEGDSVSAADALVAEGIRVDVEDPPIFRIVEPPSEGGEPVTDSGAPPPGPVDHVAAPETPTVSDEDVASGETPTV